MPIISPTKRACKFRACNSQGVSEEARRGVRIAYCEILTPQGELPIGARRLLSLRYIKSFSAPYMVQESKAADPCSIDCEYILTEEAMCIAVFLWKSHPEYQLLLALNRDELYERPTQALHWWQNNEILGGRDCKAGGTWLACSKNGRLAFLTNFREPSCIDHAVSRGDLPIRFLQSSKTCQEFACEIAQEGDTFNGFNLILADLCMGNMVYVTNRENGNSVFSREVSPGLHVLSNALLDTPWPKTQRVRHKFGDLMQKFGKEEIPEREIVEEILKDTVKPDRAVLPKTGVDPDYEYELSSIFVDCHNKEGPCGTRSMAVLSVKLSGQVTFYERYMEEKSWKEHSLSYRIPSII